MPAFVTAAFAAITWKAVVAFVVRTVISYVITSVITKAFTKKPPSSGNSSIASTSGRLVTIRQPIVAWQIIYGRCKVGGAMTFFETSTDNNTAHMIVTYSGHQCAAVEDVFFNDDYVPLSAAAATGKYAGYANAEKSLGDEGGSQPFASLVAASAGKWTTNGHLQDGRTKLYYKLTHNVDLYQTGVPNFTVIIRGVADVIDPRQSPETTGWTNNAALCLAHYLSNTDFGLKADFTTEIDEAALIAAANICDERVSLKGDTTTFTADASTDAITLADSSRLLNTGDGVRVSSAGTLPAGLAAATTYYAVPGENGVAKLAVSHDNAISGIVIDITSAGSGTHTLTYYDEPRYRLDGAFSTNDSPQSVIEAMLGAMHGKMVNTGGKWFIYAGAYDAPTITLDEDDLAGSIRVQSMNSRRENANAIKGIFTDPSNAWQPVDFPPIASSTYLAEDGNERVWKDIDVAQFVISGAQAQRLAKIELLKLRQGLTAVARFRLSALRAMTARTVAITNAKFGWTEKAFDVENLTFIAADDGRLEVDMFLRETASAIYDWSTSEEQTVDLAPNTNLPDVSSVGAPTGLTFTQSTTVAETAELEWTAPADAFVDWYQLEIRVADAGSPDPEWTVLQLVKDTFFEISGLAAGVYDVRVKSVNLFGTSSDYVTVQGTIVRQSVVTSYFGVDDLAGVSELIGLSATIVSSGFQIHNLLFCPVNGKMYGHLLNGLAFSIKPDPKDPAPVVSQLFSGREFRSIAYAPSTRNLYFTSRSLSGSPTEPRFMAVNPDDDSIVFDVETSFIQGFFAVYCPGDGNIWHAGGTDEKIYVMSPDDGSLVATVTMPSGFRPRNMVYCPTNDRMYVARNTSGAAAVAVVEITGGSPQYDVVKVIDLAVSSATVQGMAYIASEDRIVAAVSNASPTSLQFINPATDTVTDTLDVGDNARAVNYVRASDRLFVTTTAFSNSIYVVVPRTLNSILIDVGDAGANFTGAAFNPLNNKLYIGTSNSKVAVVTT